MPQRYIDQKTGTVHLFPDDATPEEIDRATQPGASQSDAESQLGPLPKASLDAIGLKPRPGPMASTAALGLQPKAASRGWGEAALAGAKDLSIGAVKGIGSTVAGLGDVIYKTVPPVHVMSDAVNAGVDWATGGQGATPPAGPTFEAARHDPSLLQPTNTAQRIGKGAEQVAEFFALPTGKAKTAAEILKMAAPAMGLTAVQGGTPADVGVVGAVTAALPVAGRIRPAVSDFLESSARQGVSKFLNATTKPLKARARAVEQGVLDRGIVGTQESVLAQATADANRAGTAIQTAERAAAAAKPGDVVDPASVLSALDRITARTVTTDAAGATVVKPGQKALNGLAAEFRGFVEGQGPKLTLEKASELKRDWQELANAANAWTADTPTKLQGIVAKKAAQAIRLEILKEAPDLGKVWSEYAFSANLRDVLTATTERTRPHMGWGKKMFAGTVAAATGGGAAAMGGGAEGLLGAGVAGAVTMAVQSPTFKLVSAQLKHNLADALASGSASSITDALGKMAPALAGGAAAR